MKLIDIYNKLNLLQTEIEKENNFSRFCLLEEAIRKLKERLIWYESKLIIDIEGEELTLIVAQERMYSEEENLKMIIGRNFADADMEELSSIIQQKIDNIKIIYNKIYEFISSVEIMDAELDDIVESIQ